MLRFFKKYHKWIGLFFSFFIIMSALSGIILNHRKAFSGVDLSRSLLPASYHYSNWNNGSVKGSFELSADSILLYGGAGVWLTDTLHSYFVDFNRGMKPGADNQTTGKIMRASDGTVFAATTFDLYRLSSGNRWECLTEQAAIDERITDLEVKGDSLVILTRSQVCIARFPFEEFRSMELKQPAGYSPDASLFRTFWLLHSGELFGTPGKLFVDLLGVVMIVLCVTGIIYTFCPSIIKRRRKKTLPVKKTVRTMQRSVKWHNKAGAWFLVFLVVLVVSGMFLRPPLMIAIIRSTVPPVPGSVLKADNPWHDKLRCLRYDSYSENWLLYASSGFYALTDLDAVPEREGRTPPVSVMGITVLEPAASGWLVGSFSGLYYWDRPTGMTIDCYNNQPVTAAPAAGRPVFDHPVSGLSNDFAGKMIVFEYDAGAQTFGADSFATMPSQIKDRHISLWHTCLEVHTGRAYRPLIGPFSDLFVFLLGLFSAFILISGYVVYKIRTSSRSRGSKVQSPCGDSNSGDNPRRPRTLKRASPQ